MKALMPMALREQAAMEMHVSLAQELSALSRRLVKAMQTCPEASTLDGLALLAECVLLPRHDLISSYGSTMTHHPLIMLCTIPLAGFGRRATRKLILK